MGVLNLLVRRRAERTGFELYGAAVAAARDPWLYTDAGAPDTLDGRFDMVGVHAWLLIRHLRKLPAPGPALAQAAFDAMFSDMDVNLREMGVSDMSVGKRVKAMWEAFHGRSAAYEAAIDSSTVAGAPDPLIEPLLRNVWRGGDDQGGAIRLARRVREQDAALSARGIEHFSRGEAGFLSNIGAAPPFSGASAA